MPAVQPSRLSVHNVIIANENTRSITIPVKLRTRENAGFEAKALIDSGAQGTFIHRILVHQLGMKEEPLQKSIPVFNVDGTPNQLGYICNQVHVSLAIGGKQTNQTLLVTHLENHDIILGHDWLQRNNPQIDWKLERIRLTDTSDQNRFSQETLQDTVIRAIQLAKDPNASNHLQVSKIETVSQDNQVNKDYVLAYTPGEVFIRTLPITTTASKAIATLWINFYPNKAQQLAQEAEKDKEEVRLPGYLE
jgi:predicted aspartyl protease